MEDGSSMWVAAFVSRSTSFTRSTRSGVPFGSTASWMPADTSSYSSSASDGSRRSTAVERGRVVLGEAMVDDELGGDCAVVGAEPRHPPVELRERAHETLVARLGDLERLAGAVGHLDVLRALADEQLLEVRLLLDEALLVADLDAIERRHGHVDVTALDELLHLPEEEGQEQRADVRAVDVGVGHHDDPVVAQLLDVELGADPAADRGHDRLDLEVREHLVDAVLLRVDHLAAEGQDRLEVLVARVDRRAAGRVALDEVELAALGVGRLAVGELAGQTAAGECPLAARPRAPCGPPAGRGRRRSPSR